MSSTDFDTLYKLTVIVYSYFEICNYLSQTTERGPTMEQKKILDIRVSKIIERIAQTEGVAVKDVLDAM